MTGSSKPKNKMLMLIKNDFLASSRVISLFYIIEVIALGVFFVGKKFDNTKIYAIGALTMTVIPLLLIFVTLFFVVYDFNKALFSQQGYLSFTLPVSSNQLLGSKLLVYGFWMLVSYAVLMIVLIYVAALSEGNEKMKMAEMLLAAFGLPAMEHLKTIVVCYVVQFFVVVFSFMCMIYFSITLSYIRTFQKAPVIWSILIFAGVFLVTTLIAYVLSEKVFCFSLRIPLFSEENIALYTSLPASDGQYHYFDLTSPITFVLMDIGLFFATSFIMHKKVNIK